MSLKNDYDQFNKSGSYQLNEAKQFSLQKDILHLLNPHPLKIFFKILLSHGLVSFFSMSLCHQFNLNPFKTNFSLHHYAMHFGGENFCEFVCGMYFLGLSFACLRFILTRDELRVLNSHLYWQGFVLTLISVTMLAFFGAELTLTITLSWMAGAFIGALLFGKISTLHVANAKSVV